MLTRLTNGRVIDPANDRDSIGDIWIEDGRIIAPPDHAQANTTIDLTGCIVMAGGIDIHTHVAGTNVNTARLLLPDLRAGTAAASVPVSHIIGRLYAAMGYTLVVEPAISPHVAPQAHLELADIPIIDTAILAVLGNDDYLLRLMAARESPAAIADYAARVLAGGRAIGIKAINPGAAAAFKSNVRSFGLDDAVPNSDVTSRAIINALQAATETLGLPHPLHLHCSNLGMPGNAETALATMAAAGDTSLHIAHLQFYAYGKDGPRGFSSAAPSLAEAVNTRPNITADIGQVMFGQTVTVSSDVLRQFNARTQAHPRKSVIMDGDGNGGGIVPYRYRKTDFYNAVQWAAGLELFLLINDPWRVFFTTDHPNGAPFTAYPDLLALLMDRSLRAQHIESLPKDAMQVTTLPSITREYTLSEIAIMTRAAPARLLGLPDRGHLGPRARADIAVYRPQPDIAAMFRDAALVLKDGIPVIRDGIPVTDPLGAHSFGRALAVRPGFQPAADQHLAAFYDTTYGVPHTAFDVPAADQLGRTQPFETVPCRT
jgi:formylmethanofuran dehydrogenase subunit A